MFARKLIFICILLLRLPSWAQNADPFLSKFFAVQVDETVFLRWTIKAGNTCNDTYVERSEDGISYSRIGIIGGICGSPDLPVTYDFIDTIPLVNRTSYYRLILGYLGYSSPKTIEFIRYNDKGFFLGPNPFKEYTRFAFENDEGLEYKLLIFNMQGGLVHDATTSGNQFILSGASLISGVYLYRIFTGDKLIFSGKLIKE